MGGTEFLKYYWDGKHALEVLLYVASAAAVSAGKLT